MMPEVETCSECPQQLLVAKRAGVDFLNGVDVVINPVEPAFGALDRVARRLAPGNLPAEEKDAIVHALDGLDKIDAQFLGASEIVVMDHIAWPVFSRDFATTLGPKPTGNIGGVHASRRDSANCSRARGGMYRTVEAALIDADARVLLADQHSHS
jgi:hypothetical protein